MNDNTNVPTQWPKEFNELKMIEELLQCGICYEYMKVAMVTPCNHNYCSLCIRKYMTYKSECPICLSITSEPELKNNRILDEIVEKFVTVRKKLFNLLQTTVIGKCAEGSSLLKFSKRNTKKANVAKKRRWSVSSNEGSANVSSSDESSSSKSIVECKVIEEPATSLSDAAKNSEKRSNPEETVTCPVCSVEIRQKNIDRHVNLCLEPSKRKTKPPSQLKSERRKPLPKLVYHILSDKDLKKKLKDHGLSVIGERHTLIKRHHVFTILYNSECDSLKPRPVSELLRQVEKQEKDEKWNGKTILNQTRLNLNRKTDPAVIEEEQKQYRATHKSQFEQLVTNLKQREKPKSQKSLSMERSTSANTSRSSVTNFSPPSSQSPEIDDCTTEPSSDFETQKTILKIRRHPSKNNQNWSGINKIEETDSDDVDTTMSEASTSQISRFTSSPIVARHLHVENLPPPVDSEDTLEMMDETGDQNIIRESGTDESEESFSLLQH